MKSSRLICLCVHYNRKTWFCLCEKVPRRLFGLGMRVCRESAATPCPHY